MTKKKEENKDVKLGDVVEKVIKKVVPKLAKKMEDCVGCEKRKRFLNNFNANFS